MAPGMLRSVNPATGEELASYPEHTAEELDRALGGNGALLKHSPNVSGCALAIEELLARAGFPPGLFRALLVGDASVAETTGRLLADPRVAAVELANDTPTGSGPASGPATWTGPGGWAGGSSPARCSSTRSSPPTPGCRSAASSAAATAASWPPPASASSPTSARSGSRPPTRPRPPP